MVQSPSIQSFFKPELPSKDCRNETIMSSAAKPSDGFTPEEIEASRHPSLPGWRPICEYKQLDIESLVPGPGCVSFVGRVVNLYQQHCSSQLPNGAEGCWRLVVKDDTGAVLVIFFAYSMPQTR